MSQLVITDLNFCESEFPIQREVKGGFFDFAIDWAADFDFKPFGQAAVGGGFAYSVAIGDKTVVDAGSGVSIS